MAKRGFTIIEIVIATGLLAIALSIYLGVQSAIVANSIRSRNEFLAGLVARSILSGIELQGNADNFKEGQMEIEQAYNLIHIPFPERDTEKRELQRLKAEVTSAPWKLTQDSAGIDQIKVRISWGDGDTDATNFTYFIPVAQETTDE